MAFDSGRRLQRPRPRASGSTEPSLGKGRVVLYQASALSGLVPFAVSVGNVSSLHLDYAQPQAFTTTSNPNSLWEMTLVCELIWGQGVLKGHVVTHRSPSPGADRRRVTPLRLGAEAAALPGCPVLCDVPVQPPRTARQAAPKGPGGGCEPCSPLRCCPMPSPPSTVAAPRRCPARPRDHNHAAPEVQTALSARHGPGKPPITALTAGRKRGPSRPRSAEVMTREISFTPLDVPACLLQPGLAQQHTALRAPPRFLLLR